MCLKLSLMLYLKKKQVIHSIKIYVVFFLNYTHNIAYTNIIRKVISNHE